MSPALDLDSLTIYKGAHSESEHRMCIMEAVAYVAGEPWSDHPVCASPVISEFLRSYNDSVSDEVRQTLKPFIPRLIGTANPALEERRALVAADWLVRTHTPAWLRLAGLTVQAEALESLPEITSMAQIPSVKGPIEAAARAALAAARDAARDAALDAALAAARDAALDAALAAAWDASRDASRDAARDAALAAARAKLAPTVFALQATVPSLIERMLNVE